MNPDYLTNVSYTNAFYDSLNPWLLNYVCAIHGFHTLKLNEGFNYCELGCGNGLSSNILAAANPQAQFTAVDLNPTHVANAKKLANAGGLANIEFIEDNFANLGKYELPEFDFITMHGVFSWISPEMRRIIAGFISEKLRPGGIVMISYNTPQGWAVIAPMRDFLRSFIDSGEGDTLENARKGLQELRYLKEANASYFKFNPMAASVLEGFFERDLRYIVHEFLTPYWQPLYFSDVLGLMRTSGLEYAGAIPVALNYGEITVPKDMQQYFKSLPNRLAFEMRKDFVNMTLFRSDVYRKPKPFAQGQDASDGYADLTFGSSLIRDRFIFSSHVPNGEVLNLDGEIFRKLADVIAESSLRVQDLYANPGLTAFTPAEIRSCIDWLVATGQVKPYSRPYTASDAEGFALSNFNRSVLADFLPGQQGISLASWTAGSGISIDPLDALAIWALAEAGLDGAEAWAGLWLVRNNVALKSDGPSLSERIRNVISRLNYCKSLGLGEIPL